MPVAIETVIIVIVVVSFAVLAAIVFALYWLWRLLLEDRRCNRMGVPRHHTQWVCADDGTQGALLGSRNRREVIVDERSRRMATKAASAYLPAVPRPAVQRPALPSPVVPRPAAPRPAVPRSAVPRHAMTSPAAPRPAMPPRVAEEPRLSDIIVLDDQEPPPPYEAISR